MGQEEVPGHVDAGGDGRGEQEGGGLEQAGAEAAAINLRKNLDGTLLQAVRPSALPHINLAHIDINRVVQTSNICADTAKANAAQVKTREISRGSNNPQIYIRRVRK